MTHLAETPAAQAANAVWATDPTAAACVDYLLSLFREELQQPAPKVARLSIALGALELPLTLKQETNQYWPADLQQQLETCLEAFEAFVGQMQDRMQGAGTLDARGKVKLVADAIWSKLTGSFSKDILHAQHVYNFAAMLLPGGNKGKRQLDCAGVVTTTYAICQRLAEGYGHADLAACSMQISEDHCWLTLDAANPDRLTSVEVTTDTAAKRGLTASVDAWAGWLYSGGHAVTCCRRRAVAALVNSLNPSVTAGKSGRDSEQVQAVQFTLLRLLWDEHRDALYPAAICSLADLEEVALQDQLDEALAARDQQRVDALLRRPGTDSDPQALFEAAIVMAASWGQASSSQATAVLAASAAGGGNQDGSWANGGSSGGLAREPEAAGGSASADGNGPAAAAASAELAASDMQGGSSRGLEAPTAAENGGGAGAGAQPSEQQQQQAGQPELAASAAAAAAAPGLEELQDPGWQWYTYSYLGGFLMRRAEFLSKCAAAFPTSADAYWAQALASLRGALQACAQGGGVLAKYKFSNTDDQLYKDVEGAFEYCSDGLALAAAAASRAAGASGSNGSGGVLSDPTLLQPVLRLWDGACLLFNGKPKPSGWVGLMLKLAKLFTPQAREAAAAAEEPRSEPMRKAQGLWAALKPVALRPLFESADVGQGEGRAIKKPRR